MVVKKILAPLLEWLYFRDTDYTYVPFNVDLQKKKKKHICSFFYLENTYGANNGWRHFCHNHVITAPLPQFGFLIIIKKININCANDWSDNNFKLIYIPMYNFRNKSIKNQWIFKCLRKCLLLNTWDLNYHNLSLWFCCLSNLFNPF